MDRSFTPFLSLPIAGIVTNEFLKRHTSLVHWLIKKDGIFLDPSFHMYLANAISHKKEGKKEIERFLVDRKKVAHIFNEKQQDILQLLLDGHTTVEIAEKLYFSISDIRSNFGRMLKIVDCADRTQLAVTAIRNGWVFCVRK